MPSTQLFIPEKIKVGFQNRSDTYTNKLGYVIYYDQKGVLRKEASWQGWRDDKIDPIEVDNKPREGFVLNKKAGGYRSDWNTRNTYIRVYDPADFEFEISVENLLFILSQCDCSRGKGLEGKFVYAWQGTELVLLPTGSEEYKNSQKFTELQGQKVKAKDLVAGCSYTDKHQRICTYLGKFEKYNMQRFWPEYKDNKYYSRWGKTDAAVEKLHVFWMEKEERFEFLKDMKTISVKNSDDVVHNFAELVQLYHKSVWGSKPVKLFTKPTKKKDGNWCIERTPGEFWLLHSQYDYQNKDQIDMTCSSVSVILENNIIKSTTCRGNYFNPECKKQRYSYYHENKQVTKDYIPPSGLRLWAELESGATYQVGDSNLIEKTKKKENNNGDED